MTTIRRTTAVKKHTSSSGNTVVFIVISFCVGLLFLCVVLFLSGSNDTTTTTLVNRSSLSRPALRLRGTIQDVVQRKRDQLRKALSTLTIGKIPARLRQLRDNHEIIGERLNEVRAGTKTVHEILHGHHTITSSSSSSSSSHSDHVPQRPMDLNEIIAFLDNYIHQLHEALVEAKHATFEGVWQAYHDLTVKTLYPWDRQYLHRMPRRRTDGSVFLSLATYRDENCFNTITNAYAKAKFPDKLFVGLIQQNCHHNCKSGVLANITMVDTPPDDDCYELFCATKLGRPICQRKQVRLLNIDEPESLGPYAARFFASKLWYGESWFMQTDAHMTFATHWDDTSIKMLQLAPSPKPILSHYPPGETYDLDGKKDKPTSRLCGPVFATSDLESQIIRLEGAGQYDKEKLDYPSFAPFTAAGYFVAHSDFLREVRLFM
jgi:[Skp1-protein]-hydroxyproline N-acetylglucosaminyltransferase